jgi:hypothetical protein
MTSLRCALATLLVLLALVGTAVAAPAAAADERRDRPSEQSPETAATTAGREDTLGLIAGGAGLLILAGIGGGAWRRHRDPGAAALGH